MKGENRSINLKDLTKCSGSDKTLFTNLPLLFANGKPVSLEKITLSELEKFIPFMVKCSLGRGVFSQKDLNSCPAPDWWPKEDFPFSFPLRGLRSRQRVNSLRGLVCRCYMYHDCEFLLKFSSQLAVMLPNIKYVQNDDNETTCIYDGGGNLLVKFRNENALYDAGKRQRKRLFPIIQPSVAKSNKNVIDLTTASEDSLDDDKQGHHFNQQKPSCLKRKSDSSVYEETGNVECSKKKKTSTRLEENQGKEHCWKPTVLDQDGFVSLFDLQRVGQSPKKVLSKCGATISKVQLAKHFLNLPFSSDRGKTLLASSRVTVNIQQHMDRIERHTITDAFAQICTRTTGISNFDNLDGEKSDIDDGSNSVDRSWVHTFKWPSKCHNPKRFHRGPELKACYVKLHRISEECIRLFMSRCFKNVATMTPEDWQDKFVICDCSLMPVISFTEDKYCAKTSDKSCSTRCSCKTGNDIASTYHSPHNLKNIVSDFGNKNISNSTNKNQSITNQSHTKILYSSSNQRSNLGRTKSGGPVLTEFPNFSFPSGTTFDNSRTMSDKITPYMAIRLPCELPKLKRLTKAPITKRLLLPTLERLSIVPSKNSIVPQNTESRANLYVKSRNNNCALQKKNVSGLNNDPPYPNTRFTKPLHCNVKALQENLIPNNKLGLTKTRKPKSRLMKI